jgi:hypothetical protein
MPTEKKERAIGMFAAPQFLSGGASTKFTGDFSKNNHDFSINATS